jgi:hypothetical protein
MCTSREIVDKLKAVLHEHAIEGVGVDTTGSNYVRLRFRHGGRQHSLIVSNTPSDRFALQHALGDLRRLLRSTGVIKVKASSMETSSTHQPVRKTQKKIEINTAWRQHRRWLQEQTQQ